MASRFAMSIARAVPALLPRATAAPLFRPSAPTVAAYRAVVNKSVVNPSAARAWAPLATQGKATAGTLLSHQVKTALATARKFTTEAAAEAAAAPKQNAFVKFMQDHPVMFAVITTLVRTAPCDLVAQLYFEKREEIDWKRFWGFMIFGALYVGVSQYYLYKHVINAANLFAITGISSRTGTALGIALTDQFVHSPLLYFPVFVLTLKIMDGTPVGELIPEAFGKWKREVFDVMYASCFLWLPAQIVNFYFMPPYLVVPFINAVGAVWVVWLSLNEGKNKAKAEAK